VLGLYIGFPRLNQLRFIARDPILTGILKVTKLPVQSTFWRFVNALHRHVARQILTIITAVQNKHKDSDPCCKQGLCVTGAKGFRLRSASVS